MGRRESSNIWRHLIGWGFGALVLLITGHSHAQFAKSFLKISSISGGLNKTLSNDAKFGIKADVIGDLDNDGTPDLAVGATNQGFPLRGSVFILFLLPDGRVKASTEIASPEATDSDSFGSAVAGIGDLDKDGNEDIAVGAGYDNPDGNRYGAVWIFFLLPDGTVKAKQKINRQEGNFSGGIVPFGNFGTGLTGLGDLDGDSVEDIAVGADLDDGLMSGSGSVYILFMNSSGTVKSHTKISGGIGGFPFSLNSEDYFGYGLGKVGDLDNDGIPEIAIGAHRDDDGGLNRGALYITYLNSNGTVKQATKISSTTGNLNETVSTFGVSATGIGDINNDGIRDVLVGSNDSNNDGGVVWYLMLNANGTVKSKHKISDSVGNTNLNLDPGDFFGGSVAFLGDINNDGLQDIGVGAFNDDDGGSDLGAFWISTGCIGVSNAGANQEICATNSTILGAIPFTDARWRTYLGTGIVAQPNFASSPVTNLNVGANAFIWESPTGCRADTVFVQVINGLTASVLIPTQLTCSTSATVIASPPSLGVGHWEVASGTAIIVNPNNPTTEVALSDAGPVSLVWKVEKTGCPTAEAPSTIDFFKLAADVLEDSLRTCTGKSTVSASPPAAGVGRWIVGTGSATISDPESLSTEVLTTGMDPVTLLWRVESYGCPPAEKEVTIFPFEIDANDIPNVITPNGDGLNDTWRILTGKPAVASVRILNRWGGTVFESTTYDNRWSAGDLAAGVYFYTVDVAGCKTSFKGNVSVIR